MHAALYSKLIQQRIEEEYSDFIIEDEDIANEFIVPAKDYVFYVEKKVEENLAG